MFQRNRLEILQRNIVSNLADVFQKHFRNACQPIQKALLTTNYYSKKCFGKYARNISSQYLKVRSHLVVWNGYNNIRL